MDLTIQKLNYDFNLQQFMFNSQNVNLLKNARDRAVAVAWVNKLTTSASNQEEAELRNDFLYYLNQHCNNGELVPPFKENPPKGPLFNILNLLVRISLGLCFDSQLYFQPDEVKAGAAKARKDKKKRKAEIFEKSPDKGAFLAAQPVPRCGAFCYLAVVSKPPDQQK